MTFDMPDTVTRLYGVIGDPIKHSKSPLMLNRAFRETGINAVYAAFHILPSELEAAVKGFRALKFGGWNVTIPHKLEIMRHLDEIDEAAKVIGAVNTVVNRGGRLIGYNTDGIGYVRSLEDEAGFHAKGKRILLLGAGGAARGVAYALAGKEPDRIWIANRTAAKAEALANDISRFADCRGIGLNEAGDIQEVDLVVNTTQIGMHPGVDETPVDVSRFPEGTLVSDIVYNPLTTRLLAESRSRGLATHSGLGMFIYQGAYAFEYWTGRAAPVETMRRIVMESLRT